MAIAGTMLSVILALSVAIGPVGEVTYPKFWKDVEAGGVGKA